MFESFKDHPLSKDVHALGEVLTQMNSHVSDELSKSIGNLTTKFLEEVQSEMKTIWGRIAKRAEIPTPKEVTSSDFQIDPATHTEGEQ